MNGREEQLLDQSCIESNGISGQRVTSSNLNFWTGETVSGLLEMELDKTREEFRIKISSYCPIFQRFHLSINIP
jgi:hypothetical protein